MLTSSMRFAASAFAVGTLALVVLPTTPSLGQAGKPAQTIDCAKIADPKQKDDCVRAASGRTGTTPATPATPGAHGGTTVPATPGNPGNPKATGPGKGRGP